MKSQERTDKQPKDFKKISSSINLLNAINRNQRKVISTISKNHPASNQFD